ncbi:hypothetical protein B4U80_13127 [Leptotrombidium deliense]|uniref:EGF-like domain-containing protein n=1 Tax=Leptotrombidium deliense TaxID=299467 RepID=A0A443SBZ1_9ACAR|nr:hypothetical protein B4U80_13127 [Leptotrombidium deliense]
MQSLINYKIIAESKLVWNRLRERRAVAAAAACEPGYQKNWWGKCVDIDECANPSTNECDGLPCINTDGSYTCVQPETAPQQNSNSDTGTCPNGYAKNWWGKCSDIDECKQPGICGNDRCENTDGDFLCVRDQQQQQQQPSPSTQCNPGYFFNKLTGICQDIDECALELDNCMESMCENTLGSFRCQTQQCYPGFEYTTAGCVDIDECIRLSDSACSREETCQNSKGSFFCQKCTRLANELQCYRRRQCMPGYEPSKLPLFACVDVNECKSGFHQCTEVEDCVNTVPGHRCECRRGYTRNLQGKCVEEHSNCGIDNVCPDMSLRDPCPSGFQVFEDGLKCVDINECLDDDICDRHSECHNYRGGYRCYVKTN